MTEVTTIVSIDEFSDSMTLRKVGQAFVNALGDGFGLSIVLHSPNGQPLMARLFGDGCHQNAVEMIEQIIKTYNVQLVKYTKKQDEMATAACNRVTRATREVAKSNESAMAHQTNIIKEGNAERNRIREGEEKPEWVKNMEAQLAKFYGKAPTTNTEEGNEMPPAVQPSPSGETKVMPKTSKQHVEAND